MRPSVNLRPDANCRHRETSVIIIIIVVVVIIIIIIIALYRRRNDRSKTLSPRSDSSPSFFLARLERGRKIKTLLAGFDCFVVGGKGADDHWARN